MVADKIRIMGVDPGNNLGIATVDYFFKTGQFVVLAACTLDLAKLIPSDENIPNRDTSLKRLVALKGFIKGWAEHWLPDIVAHETAYVPHRGGGASIYSYASLIENILTIKFSMIELSYDFRIFEINPTTVKNCIVGFKSSDKSLVYKALVEDKTVDLDKIKDIKINQHNADAIGIAITCARENINVKCVNGEFFFNYRGKQNAKRKK